MPTTPQSPPKRMTRARARAVEETKKAPARSAKITTPAAKAAAASRTAKRKDRADDEEDQAEAPANRSPPPPQPRAVTTAPAPLKAKPSASARSTKTITSSFRAGATSAVTAAATATRGRPKKTPSVATDADSLKPPPARSTRTRAGSVNINHPPANKSISKKKVTFNDPEGDKENAITSDLPKGKESAASTPKTQQVPKQAGLKAKPVRRTVTKPAATAVRRENKIQTASENEESKSDPLSPKKNVQVSVISTSGNKSPARREVATTPPRELNKSPKKAAPSSVKRTPSRLTTTTTAESLVLNAAQAEDFATSVDELQGSTAIFTSPTKPNPSFTIASPAKRPPQSPFKGSIMASPKKTAVGSGTRVFDEELGCTLSNSVMAQPPKRFPMTEPRKKVTFDDSITTGMRNSLLKSPAKRPLSPLKGPSHGSTMKVPATTSAMRVMTSSTLQGSPRRLLFSPVKQVTSSLKAMKSPEALAKVHKMTPEEQAAIFEDELVCGPSPFSSRKEDQAPRDEEKLFRPQESPFISRHPSKIPVKSPPTSPLQLKNSRFGWNMSSPGQPDVHSPSIGERVNIPPSTTSTSLEPVKSLGLQSRVENHEDEYESEDELQLIDSTSSFSSSKEPENKIADKQAPATPEPVPNPSAAGQSGNVESMTVLAERFGGWKGATPDSNVLEQRKTERSLFSPLHPIVDGLEHIPSSPDDDSYFGGDMSNFEQSILVHRDEDELMVDPEAYNPQDNPFRQSQISEASQEYGDENAIPIDPELLEAAKAPVATCTPARVFGGERTLIVHTVSKVPLKPPADYDESPFGKPAKRAHSLSAELSPNAAFEVEALRQIYPPARSRTRISDFSDQLAEEGTLAPNLNLTTPTTKTGTWSVAATPARTPRPDLNTRLLSGAVVFVDVHTTEGSDASGIFVELLTQMGARCVKQWSWNSRASLGPESGAGDLEGSGSSKVGITHVVFKDGGKRTMEKVREAKGLVLCVGVGWVLDCERENMWLDEAEYAIDTSTIPRGGHRRRKSMEPKALSNMTFATNKPAQQEALSPTKEFLNLSSPASRRATIGAPDLSDRRVSFPSQAQPVEESAPSTPAQHTTPKTVESMETPPYLGGSAESTFGSPTTPYFLHPQQLVQQTCPPKQTQQLFFPLSGRIEDEPDEGVRQRLLVARRKSLQWAPRVASPLSRAHSFQ